MTETEIQKLFAYQYGLLNNNLVLPNITMGSPGARYEADLIYINKRRYVSEVEIKISMSDFKADFKKKVYHNSDIVRQFYYLFPNDLYIENSQEIERLLMESDAGIMTVRNFRERCAKSAQGRTVSSMTNLDKIRTMPPEELGTFLSNLVAIEDCFECPIRDVCNERMVNPNNEAFHTCELSFYHWLQREYKPGYFENQ